MGLPNIPGLESIAFGGVVDKTLYWLGYGLLAFLFIGAMAVGMYLLLFKYKVKVIEVAKVGNEEKVFCRKIKSDRGRYVKEKGVRKFQLMFGRKKINPVESEFLWPNNTIFLSKINDVLVPIKPELFSNNVVLKQAAADVDFWASLEAEKASRDYQLVSNWDRYGNVVVMAGTVLFCLILVGVTVYYTYQHANGVVGALGGVTNALQTGSILPGR